MIIVRLSGGLGNQLFQYAMGMRIALLHNTQLKLDLSFFENYDWHEYSLEPFCINATVASSQEVDAIHKLHNSYFQRAIRKIINVRPFVVHEKNLLFDEGYLTSRSNCHLIGYWQCEQYFKPIDSIIREQFSIKYKPSQANQNILSDILTQPQSVSLHIRRGNFVSVNFVNKIHGTTKLDYYQQAIEHIENRLDKPIFYIFSDDIAWAKGNIKLSHQMVFIDINDAKTDYEDLRLMSACKHNILANSTFSWWGAWLNENSNKIVIAPREWFADAQKNVESRDILPNSWIRI